jgi:alpha-L-fucosidase
MKKSILFTLAFIAFALYSYGQEQTYEPPQAPAEYRRPAGYNPAQHRFPHSIQELHEKYSVEMMEKAEKEYNRVLEVNGNGKWKPSPRSLDRHTAPEWYLDAKFGMFIDWGPWSVAGWAPTGGTRANYPDWYEFDMDVRDQYIAYHEKNWGKDFYRDDLLPFFNAEKYQPDLLTDIAIEAGMKYVIPFCKHHAGFCLWPSSYTFRDMGDLQGKDAIRPLIDNCNSKGLKFGFYFSTEELEYPVIKHDGGLEMKKWSANKIKDKDGFFPYTPEMEHLASGKVAVKDFMRDYIIPQAVEFIDSYDPDILWYDGEWTTPVDQLGSYDIAAYFYNHAEGRKEVATNDRFGAAPFGRNDYSRRKRGDAFTSEYGYKDEGYGWAHAWEENRGISQSFGFNWQDTDENVITSKQFVDMFVNIVSHGGNLLLIVNLDGQGALPKVQEDRLRDIGKWIKVNGEGIYATRTFDVYREDNIRYTRSKDNTTVYAISLEWPGKELKLKSVQPAAKSQIYMLGYDQPLKWTYKNGVTTVTIPSKLQKAENRPCERAYTFRIQSL